MLTHARITSLLLHCMACCSGWHPRHHRDLNLCQSDSPAEQTLSLRPEFAGTARRALAPCHCCMHANLSLLHQRPHQKTKTTSCDFVVLRGARLDAGTASSSCRSEAIPALTTVSTCFLLDHNRKCFQDPPCGVSAASSRLAAMHTRSPNYPLVLLSCSSTQGSRMHHGEVTRQMRNCV